MLYIFFFINCHTTISDCAISGATRVVRRPVERGDGVGHVAEICRQPGLRESSQSGESL